MMNEPSSPAHLSLPGYECYVRKNPLPKKMSRIVNSYVALLVFRVSANTFFGFVSRFSPFEQRISAEKRDSFHDDDEYNQ